MHLKFSVRCVEADVLQTLNLFQFYAAFTCVAEDRFQDRNACVEMCPWRRRFCLSTGILHIGGTKDRS